GGGEGRVAAARQRRGGGEEAGGGLAAAATFRELAAALPPDPARRARRALDAAQASMRAGAFAKALKLLATADAGPLDEFQAARVDLLRGQIAFASRRGSGAPPLLLKARRGLRPTDGPPGARAYPDD